MIFLRSINTTKYTKKIIDAFSVLHIVPLHNSLEVKVQDTEHCPMIVNKYLVIQKNIFNMYLLNLLSRLIQPPFLGRTICIIR